MKVANREWIIEGTSDKESQLKSLQDAKDMILNIGFLPYFKNDIVGFSLEEFTDPTGWFSKNEKTDPWIWREQIARCGEIAYGRFFAKKTGFISKKWFPIFASYRRDGYDFDSLYEEGLVNHKSKRIMDILAVNGESPSYELKNLAGFGKGGDKGFETVITSLQMQGYVLMSDFRQKINKKGKPYGWMRTIFTTPEMLFGEDYVRDAYNKGREECFNLILNNLKTTFPDTDENSLIKLIK